MLERLLDVGRFTRETSTLVFFASLFVSVFDGLVFVPLFCGSVVLWFVSGGLEMNG